MENYTNMEFTTKDFEAVGDTIQEQRSVLLGFEHLLNLLCLNPQLVPIIISAKALLPLKKQKAIDRYMEKRRGEILQNKDIEKE